MEENNTKTLETIKTTLKELLVISKSYSMNFTSFENKYFNLKTQVAHFIEQETNKSLKECYLFKYRNIVAFETKSKGINAVRAKYIDSIKPKASVKSKKLYESSIPEAAEHIANDFDTFFNCIPGSSTNINNKL